MEKARANHPVRNRPDVQRAERQLAAATALKGAAIADMVPRVSLAMFFGVRNTALSGLMTLASKSWAAGGSVRQPLFDHGRLRAMVDASDADIERAVVEYERAVLAALHETEDALAQWLAAERERTAQGLAQADREADSRTCCASPAPGQCARSDSDAACSAGESRRSAT